MSFQWLRFALVMTAISLGTTAFVGCEMDVNERNPLEEEPAVETEAPPRNDQLNQGQVGEDPLNERQPLDQGDQGQPGDTPAQGPGVDVDVNTQPNE